MTEHDIIKHLAEKIYVLFDKEEIQNNSDGNWHAAETIIRRVINGAYPLDEWKSYFLDEQLGYLKQKHDEYVSSEDNG